MSNINPFYLNLTTKEISNIKNEFEKILKSGQLILGKHTYNFEKQFAKFIGSKYAVSVNTGTTALDFIFQRHNIKNKKIAVQSNTNFATVASIINKGGIPVLIDMDKKYFSPSLNNFKEILKIEKNIKGLCIVHMGGVIHPDINKIKKFCKSRNIFLVEDCAHSHGSVFEGCHSGNFGSGGAFSFFPTKVITTMEGGLISTNSKKDYKLYLSLRNQGRRYGNFGGKSYDLGGSFRMTEISAYLGLIQLKKIYKNLNKRKSIIENLKKELLKKNIQFVDTNHMNACSNYKFICLIPKKFKKKYVFDEFKRYNINLGGGVYDIPIHKQPVFKNLKIYSKLLKNTNNYCQKQFCLPIHPGLTDSDVNRIIKAINKIF